MILDVLVKVSKYGTYTFFMTCSVAEFKWVEIIQVLARHYGEQLSADQIENLYWNEKLKHLERNPVTPAIQIDYIFRHVTWNASYMSNFKFR